MKYLAIASAMLLSGVLYAQDQSVNFTFSGTGAPSTVDLKQPDTNNSEDNTAGDGTLGAFTFRNIRAIKNTPQASDSCTGPMQVFFASEAGGGVFRFQDGSLMKVNLTSAGDCIDLAAQQAHCTIAFQITGGTGRFKDASGTLTLTETVVPVVADATNNPVFFANTGEFTGTVSGVAAQEKAPERRR